VPPVLGKTWTFEGTTHTISMIVRPRDPDPAWAVPPADADALMAGMTVADVMLYCANCWVSVRDRCNQPSSKLAQVISFPAGRSGRRGRRRTLTGRPRNAGIRHRRLLRRSAAF